MKLETSEFMVQYLSEELSKNPPMDKAIYYSQVKAKHEKNIIKKRMLTPVSKCEYCGKMINLNGICLICKI
jgi:hypothetical protein